MNPQPTLNQPSLNLNQIQTEFLGFGFEKVLQTHAVFPPTEN